MDLVVDLRTFFAPPTAFHLPPLPPSPFHSHISTTLLSGISISAPGRWIAGPTQKIDLNKTVTDWDKCGTSISYWAYFTGHRPGRVVFTS
jgi:hypothetical protein